MFLEMITSGIFEKEYFVALFFSASSAGLKDQCSWFKGAMSNVFIFCFSTISIFFLKIFSLAHAIL